MMEKLLTFPSPTPLPYLPRPWEWGLKVEIQLFFPVQHQHNPTPPKIFVPGHHARIQDFLSGGGGGWGVGGGGGGVQAPQLILQFKEGVQWFYYTFSRGGGGVPTFSRSGAPIETHITITCDFPGGSGPPFALWIRTWTLWHFGTNRLGRTCAASF